ncbi:MAG: tRNA (adenosine(37)-N6)-threonylcarbamoyltransferase complex ATPase subunit type 1 TsaE [Phycisphaerales bacterium]|jgi:tRNA threonylcarbamoyladenosine biosynthesis protein TsaE|nr:tRNA (adenosine(37)-N6)-threonylcarbamoyltransferase complex ATPase subunit type 1 TsaE [Phycisphaerales bacterium]
MTITKSEQETHALAITFAKTLPQFAVVTLEGELGAGKTCFVRGLCEGLGGDPRQVNSPTFTIMQEYIVGEGLRLVHIDAYRLSGEDDLEAIGWEELLQDQNAVIAIEWPSRIKNALPTCSRPIQLMHVDEQSRSISF